jgi:hypothetical protein
MKRFKSIASIAREILEAGIVSNPNGVNTGHISSGRNSYSSFNGGHAAAMKRVGQQEKATKKEMEDSKNNMNSKIEKHKKESENRNNELNKNIKVEETDPDHNSELRKKINIVSRLNNDKQTSEKSKLARNAAYKTNVIDEEKPIMYSDKNFGLSKSLINVAKIVIENSLIDAKKIKMSNKKTAVEIEPKTDDKASDEAPNTLKKNKMVKEASTSCKKCGKVKCMCESGSGFNIAAIKARENGKSTFKHHGETYPVKEDIKLSNKELANLEAISELFDEAKKKKDNTTSSQTTIGSAPIRGANQDQSGFNTSGNVADYTISDEYINEAGRGRPRKNPLPANATPSEDDDREHIVMQLRKVVSTNGTKHIMHKNGQKSKLSPQMAQHALNIHNKMKTADQKQDFEDKLDKSHDSMKAALS